VRYTATRSGKEQRSEKRKHKTAAQQGKSSKNKIDRLRETPGKPLHYKVSIATLISDRVQVEVIWDKGMTCLDSLLRSAE
jgi:hypothetical protein